jgi:hypothetical protein
MATGAGYNIIHIESISNKSKELINTVVEVIAEPSSMNPPSVHLLNATKITSN